MKKKWWIFLVAPPALILFVWIFGEVVMRLWNWLLPLLFGWHTITFWQALGLLVLCRILFGGFGNGGNRRSQPKWGKGECWQRMTLEERENFREWMRTRGQGLTGTDSESKAPA
jgi:hypothetical protein